MPTCASLSLSGTCGEASEVLVVASSQSERCHCHFDDPVAGHENHTTVFESSRVSPGSPLNISSWRHLYSSPPFSLFQTRRCFSGRSVARNTRPRRASRGGALGERSESPGERQNGSALQIGPLGSHRRRPMCCHLRWRPSDKVLTNSVGRMAPTKHWALPRCLAN